VIGTLKVKDTSYDNLFDDARIAKLDRISERIRRGEKTYTVQEVAEHFEKKRGKCKTKLGRRRSRR
jgi:hypothetical protein